MSEPSWTPDQKRVIETRNKNILVSASAGSGKTAVLVQRIISLITDPQADTDIDEMLVVTFTRAAAAEMKDRILNALAKMLEADPSNEKVSRQMVLIHSAHISTIDSFCLDVLRSYYNEIDLDPSFRTGDEGEMKLLRRKVMDELLEDAYRKLLNNGGIEYEPSDAEEETADTLPDAKELEFCIDSVETGKSRGKLPELIQSLYDYSRSYADPDRWLDECIEEYASDDIPNAIRDYICSRIDSLNRRMAALASECAQTDAPAKYEEFFEAEAQALGKVRDAMAGCDLMSMGDLMSGMAFARIPSAGKRGSYDEGVKEYLQMRRTAIKKEYEAVYKAYFYDTPEKILSDIERSGRVIRTLVSLTREFAVRFATHKSRHNLIDYSDMELMAYRILAQKENDRIVPTAAAISYVNQFKSVMIDEYQDSNYLQEAILSMVSGDVSGIPNRFIVGDVKQSIYGFRLSRPELFIAKASEYAGDDNSVRIDLAQNFRSRATVLNSVNAVMERIMTEEIGGIQYDENHALVPGPDGTSGVRHASEVLLMNPEGGDPNESSRDKEAAMVAERILEMLEGEEIYDRHIGGMRPIRPGDIAILVRASKGRSEIYRKALMDRGIAAHAESTSGYFNAPEVKCILDYLKLLDNPLQDEPMASVLHSPIGGFTSEELARLKLMSPGKAFAEGILELLKYRDDIESNNVNARSDVSNMNNVKAPADENNNETGDWEAAYESNSIKAPDDEKNGNAVNEINDCAGDDSERKLTERLRERYRMVSGHRAMISYTPLHELIPQILRDTGYSLYLAALPEGAKRLANIDILTERAASYERTGFKGVFNFLNYLEQLKEQEVDFGEANVCDDAQDVVRIMTIHKSKGLEFPVVFVCDLASPLRPPERKALVINGRYKLGMTAVDTVARTRADTIYKRFIKNRNDLEELGEELRILYVAMTRAEDRLILTGTVKNPEEALNKWNGAVYLGNSLVSEELTSSSSALDILMKAICRREDLFDIKWKRADELKKIETIRQGERMLSGDLMNLIDRETVYDERLLDELKAREAFRYAYPLTGTMPVKQSVSDIKIRHLMEQTTTGADSAAPFAHMENAPIVPEFARDELNGPGLKDNVNMGALRGTAVHRFLELWDYTGYAARLGITVETPIEDYLPVTREVITEEMEKIAGEGTMDAVGLSLINRDHMLNFLNSFLGKRMLRAAVAGKLCREKMFMLGIEGEELSLVQGIIDACFEENGHMVLVDYKTDRTDTPGDLINRYEVQLRYYAQALNRLTDIPVGEILIYSFCFEKQLEL